MGFDPHASFDMLIFSRQTILTFKLQPLILNRCLLNIDRTISSNALTVYIFRTEATFGVWEPRHHLKVYRLSPGGISKLTGYINCMQNFKLVAISEMFCTDNMV